MIKRILIAFTLFAFALPAFAQSEPTVARAHFASGITDREPVDEIAQVPNTTNRVFFFTELLNLTRQRVVHRWIYQGEVIAEVPFDVGGPRWRVWSSKTMLPEWTGVWTVEVVSEGQVLTSATLQYGEDAGGIEEPAMDEAMDDKAATDEETMDEASSEAMPAKDDDMADDSMQEESMDKADDDMATDDGAMEENKEMEGGDATESSQ